MIKKRITYESVIKYCKFPTDFKVEPNMVLENAERIHDFIVENGGQNSVKARLILFGWASQELEINLKVFTEKFKEGSSESQAYKELSENEANATAYGVSFGMLLGVFLGSIFNNIGTWIPIGLMIGLVGGAYYTESSKNKNR